ncbi:hypothetical protein DHW03_09575 [Pedobacter yonginense]|uniref:PKD domain-containing protein n=1 Tax=Pedobacter yonginense TaxID=651869 RepID=A0A317ER89_9SPHI|nr:PKD domain-containing protein [Pedobacter yonginense]PWS27816.1 hypothetical protein DHW03_09575 [Pedobacter yonginense]
MKTSCRRKWHCVALLVGVLFFTSSCFAQLNITNVDAGPYTPGSTIAALFNIDPATCISQGNTFQLYLSDANGNFATETQIGTYTSFYSTYVNGTIPNGTPPGTGYRLRIKSTTPAMVSSTSVPFEIKAGAAVSANISSSPLLKSTDPETFGTCIPAANKDFFFNDLSTAGSTVTASIIDEINGGTVGNLNFASGVPSFRAQLAHYTIFTKALRPDGTVGTKAYLIVNNPVVTAFATSGNNIVCLPAGFLEFTVTTSGTGGIQNNFPGDIYKINWGDNTTSTFTLCDILTNSDKVRHLYTKSSCGINSTGSSGTIYNVFDVVVSVNNSFCGDIGTAVSTTAKVVVKPVNSFTFGTPGCKATDITFVNTSVVGENPNTNTPGCTPNNVTYNWFVDGVIVKANQPRSYNLVYNFPTRGPHIIRLESNSNGACNADPVEMPICIQDPPQPAFTLPSHTVCAPGTLKATDTSIIDPICSGTNIYNWTVSPAVTFANGTTAASKEPEFNFTVPGDYVITLSISSASCGNIVSAPQTVVVNTNPTAVLSPDIVLCNLATYDFNPTTTGPTKTTITGSAPGALNPYLWTITGGSFTFTGGTSATSQYPSIKFNDYVEYTITVTHTNNCGTATATQKLNFITAPVVNAGPDQTTCFIGANFALNGAITGTIISQSWVGGAGTFNPDRNALNATYTPTAAEKAAGSVNLILRAITGLTGTCAQVDDEVVLTIAPNVTINSSATKTICTGTSVNYTPTSNPTGATYTWTATGSAAAAGFTASGSGSINDILTNSDLSADATVTYIITPRLNNCDGVPFTLVVTIKAQSVGGTTSGDAAVCSGGNGGNISLSGQIGSIVRWERSVDNGVSWLPIASTANPFVFSNLTVTTQFRAVVSNGICAEANSSITTITVNPGTTTSNAGANQSLCSGNQVTLNGNNPAPYTGIWTLVSGQTSVTITDPTLYNTTVTGLVPGENYTFRWTISGFATCPSTFAETTVTYYASLVNTVTAALTTVCSGSNTAIVGNTPTGGNGTYNFQWQSSPDGTSWTDINGQTGKDLSVTITTSTFYRRIVNSSTCTSNSNVIQIQTVAGIANNTVSANQSICAGDLASPLTGLTPTGGSGTYTYQWQSSLDNGVTWLDVIGATGINFAPPQPTTTILYRRLVSSGACSNNVSNQVKITVNPVAKAEITFLTDKGCTPFILTPANVKATPYPDRNNTYTWFADNGQIGTGITFPGYTIVGDNKTVVIKLVVTSSLGCIGAETSHAFSTQQSITASYTQSATQGCGPLSVNFTNTSNSLTGSTFKWDFGNGTTSNLAQPPAVVYQADPTGKDITYTVVLTATTPCGATTQTSTVFVQGKAVSIFSPDKTAGCSPLSVNFSNTSPVSSGTTYTFDFNDGSPLLTTTDRSTVSHTFTTLVVRDYVITMTAENSCGKSTSSYTLRVSPNDITPEMVVNANELQGCAPLTVNFYNNTKGASRFVYDFGDGTGAQVTNSAPEVVQHVFTKGGVYTVTLYATNNCSSAQTTETITVLEQPTVGFTSDRTIGCDGTLVKFKNTSTNAIGYLWDFGDGTTSAEFEPQHTYNGSGKNYTVTLTSTNSLGCKNSVTVQNYINIVAPPQAFFSINPGNETSIPNYTFNFKDTSLGAVSWEWNFGDGSVSTLQNPNHTYAEEGVYNVTLKIISKEGCTANTFQSVRIIGVPGYLNLPNSFMPASAKNELRTFKAKGRGMQEWRMMVFNKWGEMLWETTKLDDGGPQEGWDGTYNGQPQPQGVYYWRIEVKFINGSDWKGMTYDSSPPRKTGLIYLIR